MPETPEFTLCESQYAGGRSLEHIRRVGPEGIKLGGGAPAPLCGRPWSGGWDLLAPITPLRLKAAFVCTACAEKYLAETG